MKKTGITIRIEDDLRELIEMKAKMKDVTVSEHLRDVLWDAHVIII